MATYNNFVSSFKASSLLSFAKTLSSEGRYFIEQKGKNTMSNSNPLAEWYVPIEIFAFKSNTPIRFFKICGIIFFARSFSSTKSTSSRFLTKIAILWFPDILIAASTIQSNSASSSLHFTIAGNGDDAVGNTGSTKSCLSSKYFDFEIATANWAISLLFL